MKMVEIEIQIDSFKDEEKFNQITSINRNGKKVELINKLFFKGDTYSVSKERAKELVDNGIAKIVKEKKESGE